MIIGAVKDIIDTVLSGDRPEETAHVLKIFSMLLR
jgi:hypothetical protein